jgi:outer membrane protein assembly complex protein YaeT
VNRILVWSLRILAAALVLAVAGVTVLHVPAVQRRLVAYGLGLLNRSGRVIVESESISFSLLQREARVDGLTIRARAGDLAFIRLDRALVRWRYRNLTRGLSALEFVDAEGLTIDIARLPAGELNLPASSGGGEPVTGLPRRATIRRVNVLYSDAPFTLCLNGLDVDLEDGRWTLATPLAGSVAFGSYSGTIQPLRFNGELTSAALAGVTARGTVAVEGLTVPQVGRVSIEAAADFRGAMEQLRLTGIQVDSSLARIGGSIDLSLAEATSRADLRAEGRGEARGLTAEASLTWPGVAAEKATGTARITAARNDIRALAEVTLTDQQVRVDARRVQGFDATAAGFLTLNRSTERLGGRLTATYAVLEGAVQLNASIAGTLSDPRASVTAQSTDLALDKVRGIGLDAAAKVSRRSVEIETARITWQDQGIDVSGRVGLTGSPALEIDVIGEGIDVRPFLAAYQIEGEAAGTVSLAAQIRGPAADPVVTARLTGAGLAAFGEPIGELTAAVGYRSRFLSVDELRLEKPGAEKTGVLNASGWADLAEETLYFRVDSTPLPVESVQIDARPLRGEVSVRGEARGSFDRPQGEVEITARGENIGEAFANASVQDGRLNFGVAADALRLDLLGVSGSADLRARGGGPWGDWDRLEASATIPRIEAIVEQNRVVNRGPIELSFASQTVTVARLAVESDGAVIEVSGALPLDAPRPDATLSVQGQIPVVLANCYLPPGAGVQVDGKISLRATVAGTVREPKPEAVAELTDGSVIVAGLPVPITGIEASVRANLERAELTSFRAPVGGGSISAEATVPYKDQPVRFRVLADRVDWASVALPQPNRKSVLTAEITGEAAKPSLEELTASARVSELSISGRRGELKQTSETRLSVSRGVLTVENFEIDGRETSVKATGTVGLLGDRPLDLRVDGKLNTEILTPQTTDLAIAGLAEAHVRITGTIAKPDVRGDAELAGGQLFVNSPPLAADQMSIQARFEGQKVTIRALRAVVNGGRVTGGGTFTVAADGLRDVDLNLNGRGLFLEYPAGFQTASDLNLTLKSDGRLVVLGGAVNILDGAFREPIDIALLLRARGGRISLSDEPNPFVENLRFNVAVRTRQPILIDNNLGRVSADADLRLVGSANRPGLTGRLELGDDGQIYFSGRTFTITTGVIDFTDESAIAPRFNLAAETRVSNYDIILKMTGELGDLKTNFTSEPAANEDQVMALLFTGSIDNARRGAAYAQTQLLTLFGSSLTGGLATRLRNTFGISELRIDPGIVSADSDPTARLTLGQNLTPELKFTYSTSLSDAQDQIWIAEYDWRRRFLARYFRQTDQSNRGEFRQKIRFGGGSKTGDFTTRPKRREYLIGDIAISGNPVFDEAVILKRLGLKKGKKYNFLKAQKGLERLRAFYAKNGYAEVRIQQDRQRDEGAVQLRFEIDAGDKVRFVYEGATPSRSMQARLARLWQQGLIERQRMGTTQTELRRYYIRKGFADALVLAEIKPSESEKTVIYEIDRGRDYGRPRVALPGAPEEWVSEIRSAVRSQKLDYDAKQNPENVSKFVERYLRVQGYLSAKAETATVEVLDGKHTTVTVPVSAGPEFRLGQVRYEGNQAVDAATLDREIVLAPGDPYKPEDRYVVSRRVQQSFWNRGYRQAEVDAEEILDEATGRANLLVKVDQKQLLQVASIDIEGLAKTKEKYVRKLITIDEGEVLSALEVNNSRRNLLDSGAYNLIDFTYPPIDQVARPESAPQPVALRINVREPKPYRFDYGVTYDTVRGPGFIADFSTINVLGEARTLGFRTLLDRERQEYRTYFTQPFFGSKRINTTATGFFRKEQLSVFDTRTWGLTAQQYVQFGPRFNLTYGYKLETAEVTLREFDIGFRGTSAPAIAALVRDTRDNALDASKGSFLSSSFEYAPQWLGGDITYFRFYQQAFKYFGLTRPTLMPFEADQRRSHTVFATAVRLGIANTVEGNEFLPVDRFFAGGGTTIRGYEQNSLGPQLDRQGLGGRAVFILNNELRFPLWKFVDGATFIDAGNVWDTPSQFRLTDLRGGAGFGVRIRNPFILLRFDYGIKLGRRPGESIGGFYFSIGQAF